MVKLTLFSQITSLIPRQLFADIVKKYEGDKYSKEIDSWTQLISMIFCHLGQLSSVRDISNGLRSITGNIVLLGCSLAEHFIHQPVQNQQNIMRSSTTHG
ncbi:MAG: hypothetical protein PWR20_312 [Bacteroidales bacterium]|jgi:hypothetical protein|nr:hypothetical protein [Bacteroidales bacterium]MDN5329997.1 hypothetical protein [Bacteroidales bacterium]